MNQRTITTGLIVAGLFMSFSVNAALFDRGAGFIYDDVLNITWTQDANINSFDTWDNQVAWADGLSLFDSVRNVTWDDWRLPSADFNDDDTIVDCSSAPELACRDNEYGYMFFQNSVTGAAPGLFTNLQSSVYWSGTEFASNPAGAWNFFFAAGTQVAAAKNLTNFAWAVRPGDVAVVPVPAAVWLFGSALGLLGWMRRKAV